MKNKRKRKIIWFNPPYSMNVKTNIGKIFLQLLEKHFPRHNDLHKIFNKNSVTVTYSCMGSVSSIIASHNHKVLRPQNSEQYGVTVDHNQIVPFRINVLPQK